MIKGFKRFSLVVGLGAMLALGACGGDTEEESTDDAPETTETEESAETTGASYGEDMDYQITGIEAGAGVVKAAENSVEEYDLDGWQVVTSSSGAMATALGEAISNEEPIVVTGWSPHWKFAKYDLKYLEDPQGVFGDVETINTVVREGFEEDYPEAYEVLNNFYWEPEDLEEVMLKVSEGTDPKEAGAEWIEENEDVVADWIDGVDDVSGESLELVYVEWDTEIGSTNMIANVLEKIGYEVTVTPLDNAVMWEAVATGEADGMVAAWLPHTHGDLYEEYKDEIVDLGPNLEGAKIGLVVPEYMDIDSIEDLNN